MELFPAIDLQGGACVRLKQGDFEDATIYGRDPLAVARLFEEAGAKWLHLVDLDGAKDGAARQTPIIEKLARETKLFVQTGGGVRSEEDVQRLLDAGVRRVVIGSLAAEAPEKVRAWIEKFGGDKIILALDVRLDANGAAEILTRGWQDRSGVLMGQLLDSYKGSGLQALLCTDVSRDGMLAGPNFELYKKLLNIVMPAQAGIPFGFDKRIEILASGGVSSLDDIRALAEMGLAGAIAGKAIYEKKFDLAEAIQLARGGKDAR